jgi:hypothetical protein
MCVAILLVTACSASEPVPLGESSTALSLHAWDPLDKTRATLKALVESLLKVPC